jgi:RIO kinase 1
MQMPQSLLDLLDDGVVQEVIRPLKSGKEASVFVVRADDAVCAAKVYKEARHRNFRQRLDYVEGRQVGDSRRQRAMDRGSRYGKAQREAAWQEVEAQAMQRLLAAGVRVPRVSNAGGGVLLMDLVLDARGEPAPQMAHVRFTREEAARTHAMLLRQITRMLCAGLIHADLSEFNVLIAADGPMIIDFPQAVEAAKNNQAKRLLQRDIGNVTRYLGKFDPGLFKGRFGDEMWQLYQSTELRPDSVLTGRYQAPTGGVDAELILREVQAAKAEAAKRELVQAIRRERAQQNPGRARSQRP